jgi:hypothetical protein
MRCYIPPIVFDDDYLPSIGYQPSILVAPHVLPVT